MTNENNLSGAIKRHADLVLRAGSETHDTDEWRRRSIEYHLAHALYHIALAQMGHRVDPVTGKHPLAHAMVRCGMALEMVDPAVNHTDQKYQPSGPTTGGCDDG